MYFIIFRLCTNIGMHTCIIDHNISEGGGAERLFFLESHQEIMNKAPEITSVRNDIISDKEVAYY
jgi:hypothetical protein